MNLFRGRSALLGGIALGALIGAVNAAQAGAFLLREQSAVGTGLSTAGAAAGGAGLGSMFWNPAAVTDYAGLQSSSVLTGIQPSATNTSGAASSYAAFGTNSGDIAQGAVLPASYYSYQVNDKLWVAASITSPFGLETRNPVNWAGSPFGIHSKITSVDLNPSVAYKINDTLSVALGIQVLYFRAFQTNGIPNPANPPAGPTALGITTLKAASWGVGATAGITWKPVAGTEIGLGYRSQVNENLSGTFSASAPANTVNAVKFSAATPDIYTLGVRQRITNDFDLLAGFEYDVWHLGTIPVINSATGAQATVPFLGSPVALQFNYNNGWLASLGGEYKWNQNLTLRAGAAYEKSPIDNANRAITLPDSDRIWLSVGAGYKVTDKLTADIGYAHLFGRDGTVTQTAGGGLLTYTGTTTAYVDILSASLTYRYDTPARPALVAKY